MEDKKKEIKKCSIDPEMYSPKIGQKLDSKYCVPLVLKPLDSTESRDTKDVVNTLFISPDNRVITRQFALIPQDIDKNNSYKKLDQYFKQLVIFQNHLLRKMYDSYKNGDVKLNVFANPSTPSMITNVFNPLHLGEARKKFPITINLEKLFFKERIARCAALSPFHAFRNWLVRNNNLARIANELCSRFSVPNNEFNGELLIDFLGDGTLPYGYLKDVLSEKTISDDIFGKKETDLSNPFVSNMVKQLRNLLFSHFRGSIDDVLSIKLLEIKKGLASPDANSYLSDFSDFCLSTFYRTVDKKRVLIPLRDLTRYFLDNYFTTLKKIDTKRKKRSILKSKSNSEISSLKLKEFLKNNKKERDVIYDNSKTTILKSLNLFNVKKILILSFNSILKRIEDNTKEGISLSKLVLSPTFRRFRFSEPSFENFSIYLGNKLLNKVFSHFRELFISPELFSVVNEGLLNLSKWFGANDAKEIKLPVIRSSALNIVDANVITAKSNNYNENVKTFNQLIRERKFQISFVPSEFLEFVFGNNANKTKPDGLSQIFKKYAEKNGTSQIVEINLPTVTYRNHKLILHLSFEVRKKALLSGVIKEKRVLGLDLGLIDFGVVSIYDKTTLLPTEIARYFIGQTQLFDMKFVDGKFVRQNRFENPKNSQCNKCISNKIECKMCKSNVKRRLINIHSTIQKVQSKRNARANELKAKGITDYCSDAEYNRLENTLSLLWERVRHINLEIVRVLQHDVIEIAKYHKVSEVHVEDLRFSAHSKRSDIGRFISFWQVHWLFSAIQDAIELQAYLNNIGFKKVRAEYTSQKCSTCNNGKLGERDGKIFRCKEMHYVKNYRTKKFESKSIQLDADLNASRNIALAEA